MLAPTSAVTRDPASVTAHVPDRDLIGEFPSRSPPSPEGPVPIPKRTDTVLASMFAVARSGFVTAHVPDRDRVGTASVPVHT
jgi:hypothetical protein